MDPDWKLKPRMGKDQYPHDNGEMINDIHILNIYNKCFIDNDEGQVQANKLFNKFKDIDIRVYPYLNFNYPLFEHWDGEIVYTPPKNINKFKSTNQNNKNLKDTINKSNIVKVDEKKSPFWSQFKSRINGDGIVVSISDDFVEEVVKLVTMLRVLGNKLPIQFMYRNDLSDENKNKIISVARGNFNMELDYSKVENNRFFTRNSPQQDIWFVNLWYCINDEYQNSFQKYFQKELAYVFNSFQNIILIDTDVILFKPPEELFNSNAFVNSRSLFFKDRGTSMRMSDAYIEKFIKQATPNLIDNILFQMDTVNPKMWGREYFKQKYFHYQESGIVVIDRLKYWHGVILTPHLSQIQSTLTGSWGDKEHFFLGLVLSGYDSFEFNEYWAASAGELESSPNGGDWHRICSGHPSHIDQDDDTLLWMNSGSLMCPLRDGDFPLQDLQYFEKYWGFTKIEELIDYYSNVPIIINAIMPPNSEYNDGYLEDDLMPVYPHLGFQQLPLCNDRLWCAYDKIRDGSQREFYGKIFEFDQELLDWYYYILFSHQNRQVF